MTVKIIAILACVPFYVINSFCDKIVSLKYGNQSKILYNCIKFLFGGIIFLPLFLFDNSPKFACGTIICGLICGIMYAINKTVILNGYEKTSIIFMTFCHSAGMITPCIIGNFLWNEKLSFLSISGIILTVFSIVILTDTKKENKKFDALGIIIGIIVFLASGGVMITQKLMGIYFCNQSIKAYNFYSFFTAFIILSCFSKPRKATEYKKLKLMSVYALLSAVSLCIISAVMTYLAISIPSIILFPLFNGLGIICVSIGSAAVFKENLTIKKVIGIILGICGLCVINF